MPPAEVRIAVEAPNAVSGICSPVNKTDPRPSQNRTSLVVFDDNSLPCNPASLPEKAQGMFFMVQDVSQEHAIEGVVIMGYRLSVVGINRNRALRPRAGF